MTHAELNSTTQTVENECRATFGANLKGVILFGSGNTDDYVKGVSDLDFFLILESLTAKDIIKLGEIQKVISEASNIAVDLKPISMTELRTVECLNTSSEFFNGWSLYAISSGRQKMLYSTEELRTLFANIHVNIKHLALERMYYYLHKLRKIIQGKNHIYHNQTRELSIEEKNKIIASCFKNVLTFFLAHKNRFVYTNKELLQQITDAHIKQQLEQLFERKSKNVYDPAAIEEFYDLLEQYLTDYLRERAVCENQ